MSKDAGPLDCFAITAPDLESVCANELRALGLRPKVETGGVTWSGPVDTIATANLWLRTASRVIVRVAEFRVTAFHELERRANRIEWERFVAPGAAVEFRVTCRKSKLYHSDAVAERLMTAVDKRVPGARSTSGAQADDDEIAHDAQLFVVRIFHDVCTVSVDTSGELLHRRGYRQEVGKAPLRETLAAAMLLESGWNGSTALLDPMCGSGTIPIEAARIARRMAPGRGRSFAFWSWPSIDETMYGPIRERALEQELDASPVRIEGTDRDEGAIAAAKANADRANVADDIAFDARAISAMSAADPPGLVATNPPYGVRVGETDALRNLYARFGDVLRERRSGWSVAILAADPNLLRQTRLSLSDRLETRNGGISVRLSVGHIGSSSTVGDILP